MCFTADDQVDEKIYDTCVAKMADEISFENMTWWWKDDIEKENKVWEYRIDDMNVESMIPDRCEK